MVGLIIIFQNLGQVDRPKPIITLVNSNNSGQQVTGQGNNSAKNTIPNIPSSNRDNLYAMNTKSEFNTPGV